MENSSYVCLGNLDYDYCVGSEKYIPLHLAKHAVVLLVERPVTVIHLLKRSRWVKIARWRKGIRIVEPNYYLTCPPPLLPFESRMQLVGWINSKILSHHVKKVIKTLGLRDPILILFGLDYYMAIRHIPHSLLCYRCKDAYYALPGVPTKWAMKAETALLSAADVVFTASERLRAVLSEMHSAVYHVSNGVDYKLFSKAIREDTRVPDDIASIPGPIIGVVGSLDENLDLELMTYLASCYPAWSFVFIGPISTRPLGYLSGFQKKLGEFREYSNVYFLGSRSQDILPNYLKAISVGIIAYKVDLAGISRDPLKAYEYLAAGKPVVSVDIPALRTDDSLIRIAKSPQEFGLHIEECLSDTNNAMLIQKRQLYAQLHSWECKVETLRIILGRYYDSMQR